MDVGMRCHWFLYADWLKRGIYRCTDEVVFTPCSVVIDGFDKYNLIARVLFLCFKLPTVITEVSERARLRWGV